MKVNDKVICINNDDFDILELHKTYKIHMIRSYNENMIKVYGITTSFSTKRFIELDKYRTLKIKNIKRKINERIS